MIRSSTAGNDGDDDIQQLAPTRLTAISEESLAWGADDGAAPSSPADENAGGRGIGGAAGRRGESAVQRFFSRGGGGGGGWPFGAERSHETHFPPSVAFPAHDGRRVCLGVFGTLDGLDGTTMRLRTPRGVCQAELAARPEYGGVLEYIGPKLRNGDLLVRPFVSRFSRHPDVAMVVRGAVQECVFKCHIVGLFPMKVFGGELPVPYAMDVHLY